MIKVLYFARLKESLSYSEEDIQLPDDIHTVASLKQYLTQRGEPWATLFAASANTRAAINHQLVDNQARIQAGDEVAFFPPVTGG